MGNYTYTIVSLLVIICMFLSIKLYDGERKRKRQETELKVLSSSREGLLTVYEQTAKDRDEYKRLLETACRDVQELRSRLSAVVTVEAHKSLLHTEAARDRAHHKTVDEIAAELGRQIKPHILISWLIFADSISYTASLSLYKGGETPHGSQEQTP